MNSHVRWSRTATSYLLENYGKVSNATIAKQLGRSEAAVAAMASALGLHRFRGMAGTAAPDFKALIAAERQRIVEEMKHDRIIG